MSLQAKGIQVGIEYKYEAYSESKYRFTVKKIE
jgi:hypothetical protein